MRAVNFGGRDGDAVALLQHLILGAGLAIDADQIVLRLGRTDLLLEKLGDSRTVGHVHIVGETVELSTSLAARTRLQNRT